MNNQHLGIDESERKVIPYQQDHKQLYLFIRKTEDYDPTIYMVDEPTTTPFGFCYGVYTAEITDSVVNQGPYLGFVIINKDFKLLDILTELWQDSSYTEEKPDEVAVDNNGKFIPLTAIIDENLMQIFQ